MPGDVCHVDAHGLTNGLVLSGATKPVCEEFLKAIRLNDTDGLKELANSGKLLTPREGDGIRILSVSFRSDCVEGRMTTGDFKATRVWTFQNWIVK